jgi:dTDP-4-amino-4,6-dideoxygalactose transaminase
MSGARAGLLASWLEKSARMNRARIERLSWLGSAAGKLAPAAGTPCLRLPVMCASRAERDRLCEAGRREGLGIVPMYPTAVNGIRELAGLVGRNRYPGAEAVAERLVTVPVHPLVMETDIEAIRRLLSDATGRKE